MSRRHNAVRAAGIGLATVALLAGCSSRGSDQRSARKEATTFYDAISASDGEAACRQLTEPAIQAIERSSSKDCAQGVLDEDLPEPGGSSRSDVFGTEARVTFSGDTVFLSQVDGEWRVAAAGCEPSPGAPFDCLIGA